jgi:hypothetical protein
VIVGRYKGPVFGAPLPARDEPAWPVSPPPAPVASAGTVFAGPAPAFAGVEPMGAPGETGTVYQGPPPGSPALAASSGAARSSTPVFTVMRKLRVGETLSESLAIYFRNIIPFTILTAAAFSPIYLFAGFLTRQAATSHPATAALGGSLVVLATVLLCIPISTATITYGVFQQMRGRDTSLGSCLSVGLSNLLPVFSVAFLQILLVVGAVLVTLIPILFLIGMMASAGTRSSAACSLMLVPLLFLAYVPALMLWLRYFVAVPAAVEERPGAADALRRSAFLTEGQRGPMFGVLLVLGVLNGGVGLGSAMIPRAGAVLEPLVSLVMTGIFSTTCAVIYYRLRSFHESIDVDQIASVFA